MTWQKKLAAADEAVVMLKQRQQRRTWRCCITLCISMTKPKCLNDHLSHKNECNSSGQLRSALKAVSEQSERRHRSLFEFSEEFLLIALKILTKNSDPYPCEQAPNSLFCWFT